MILVMFFTKNLTPVMPEDHGSIRNIQDKESVNENLEKTFNDSINNIL